MNFKEALKILEIEDYGERIFNSNSNGELIHLNDYIYLAENLIDGKGKEFRKSFLEMVDYANENWNRPESVYQYIPESFL